MARHWLFKKKPDLPPRDEPVGDVKLKQAIELKKVVAKQQEMAPDEFASAVRKALEVRPA